MHNRCTMPLALLLLLSTACAKGQTAATGPSGPSPASGQLFNVTGVVKDMRGQPVLEGEAILQPQAGGNTLLRSQISASDGTFSFLGVLAGKYVLNVTSSNSAYLPASIPLTITADLEVPVTVTASPTVTISGRVLSADTSLPVAGARVYLNGDPTPVQADGTGFYSGSTRLVRGPLDAGENFLWTDASGYDEAMFYIRSATQDFHLHPIQHLVVGTAAQVVVAPEDSLCSNSVQDPSFGDTGYVCRNVHITAPAGGDLTIESVSSTGAHYPLVAQDAAMPGARCCDVSNPTAFAAKAGEDIIVWVESPWPAAASQTFLVIASFKPSALTAASSGLASLGGPMWLPPSRIAPETHAASAPRKLTPRLRR